MMKGRSQRGLTVSEQLAAAGGASGRGTKAESLGANGSLVGASLASQQASAAAAARKRRSSINVYDQPSSLNSRLRQLETDMLRLDEDRTKLFDDTHSALAQYELKVGEIHAILKSRQDNVEKYVEDMRTLLAAKEEFEKQTKLLNEKHDRIHEKFMHRETIISREIKLLKNKFEVLEKNRQFRSMLQKSNLAGSGAACDSATLASDDGGGGGGNLDGSADARNRSDTLESTASGGLGAAGGRGDPRAPNKLGPGAGTSGGGLGGAFASLAGKKSVRIKLSRLGELGALLGPIFGLRAKGRRRRQAGSRVRRRSNRVASVAADETPATEQAPSASAGHTDPSPASALPPPPLVGEALAESAPAAGAQQDAGRAARGRRSLLARLFTSAPKT